MQPRPSSVLQMIDRSCRVHSWCWGASTRWEVASPTVMSSTEVNTHTHRQGSSSTPCQSNRLDDGVNQVICI